MSLKLTYHDPSGVSVVDAVHKITSTRYVWHPTDPVLVVDVGTYVDLDKSRDGTPAVCCRDYRMLTYDKASATNQHTQAYTWLKTLPDFAGAVDA